jgi:hypothetical protein
MHQKSNFKTDRVAVLDKERTGILGNNDKARIQNNVKTMASSESNDNEYWNFVRMAILFSANHGCVVACLSLATARLGTAGAYSSGILYVVLIVAETMHELRMCSDAPRLQSHNKLLLRLLSLSLSLYFLRGAATLHTRYRVYSARRPLLRNCDRAMRWWRVWAFIVATWRPFGAPPAFHIYRIS